MQFLRSTLEQGVALAAGVPQKYDLPVNPLSVIFLTVQALNNDAALTDYSVVTALLRSLGHINVAYRGANIIDGDSEDLAVMYGCLSELPINERAAVSVNNNPRALTLMLCFGRTPYDPNECFPATRRGDLILTITPDLPQTGLDTFELLIETAELLDAKPKQFCKVTTITRPVLQTGDFDLELPISNDILGCLLFDPTPPAEADELQVFAKTILMMDNVTMYYNATNWDVIHGELRRRFDTSQYEAHFHDIPAGTDAAGGVTGQQQLDEAFITSYAYLDFDPLKDGSFALETQGAARVNLRVTATTTNEDTPARALPIELVVIGGKEMAQPAAG